MANQECERCQQAIEDVVHAIRDCPWAREIWELLIPSCLHCQFFSLELECWMDIERARLSQGRNALGGDDHDCLHQWQWRNEEIFQGTRMAL